MMERRVESSVFWFGARMRERRLVRNHLRETHKVHPHFHLREFFDFISDEQFTKWIPISFLRIVEGRQEEELDEEPVFSFWIRMFLSQPGMTQKQKQRSSLLLSSSSLLFLLLLLILFILHTLSCVHFVGLLVEEGFGEREEVVKRKKVEGEVVEGTKSPDFEGGRGRREGEGRRTSSLREVIEIIHAFVVCQPVGGRRLR